MGDLLLGLMDLGGNNLLEENNLFAIAFAVHALREVAPHQDEAKAVVLESSRARQPLSPVKLICLNFWNQKSFSKVANSCAR